MSQDIATPYDTTERLFRRYEPCFTIAITEWPTAVRIAPSHRKVQSDRVQCGSALTAFNARNFPFLDERVVAADAKDKMSRLRVTLINDEVWILPKGADPVGTFTVLPLNSSSAFSTETLVIRETPTITTTSVCDFKPQTHLDLSSFIDLVDRSVITGPFRIILPPNLTPEDVRQAIGDRLNVVLQPVHDELMLF